MWETFEIIQKPLLVYFLSSYKLKVLFLLLKNKLAHKVRDYPPFASPSLHSQIVKPSPPKLPNKP